MRKALSRVTISAIGVATAVALALVLHDRESLYRAQSAQNALNQQGIDFVSYLMVDELNSILHGAGTATPESELLPLFRLDNHVTAEGYEAAYDDNEIAADKEFQGKRILVTGSVFGIEKDILNEGLLILRGSGPLGVHAQLTPAGSDGAASFHKGQDVTIVCTAGGRILDTATLKDCDTFDDYRVVSLPNLKTTVADFLGGRAALPRQLAVEVTTVYVVGSSMPADSACLKGSWDRCEDELLSTLKDPTRVAEVQRRANQMMIPLKVY